MGLTFWWGERGSGPFEDEVVHRSHAAVPGGFRVQHQFGFGGLGDVAVEPLPAFEVQLSGDRPVPGRAHDQVQVRWPPRVPARGLDQLAGGAVIW